MQCIGMLPFPDRLSSNYVLAHYARIVEANSGMVYKQPLQTMKQAQGQLYTTV